MRPSDEVMWNIEVDPILRSTVTAVALLDAPPDWDELSERVLDAVDLLPRLRQRVVEPRTLLGSPSWVTERDLDLAHHLRRVGLPRPATLREVLDLAGQLAMEPFDVSLPLWQITLVEGLADGSAALIQKFHHAIMDGEGAIALERLLLDGGDEDGRRAEARRRRAAPVEGPEPSSPTIGGALLEVGRAGWDAFDHAAQVPGTIARLALGGVRHPVRTFDDGWRLAGSIGRAVAPVPESSSPLLQGRGLTRRFDTIDVLLEDLRAAGHAAGGTVNDAFLAAVVGGLTRYHLAHGVTVPELHLTMPVSVRAASDDLEGNRFAPVRFSVPTDIGDPAERITHLSELALGWKHEPFLQHTDAIATVLARLPKPVTASLFGGMLKHVDAVATNVTGLTEPAHLAGARIVRAYAFAPPTGAALNISLLSHLDRACIGVVLDTTAVPDDACLLDSLVGGFDEVISIADHHARRTG